MNYIDIDIETAPDIDRIHEIFTRPEFNPEAVPLGNAKKQDTIDSKIEEARAYYYSPEGEEAFWEDLYSKGQLSGYLGYPCLTGFRVSGGAYGYVTIYNVDSVADGLRRVFGALQDAYKEASALYGFPPIVRIWSGSGNRSLFDIEYLVDSARSNHVVVPSFLYKAGRNPFDGIVDLAQIFLHNDPHKYCKLEYAATVLGLLPNVSKGDVAEGKDFYKDFYSGDPVKVQKCFDRNKLDVELVGAIGDSLIY